MRGAVAALVAACIAGCGPKPPPMPTCEDTFLGDPAQAAEGVIVTTDGVAPKMIDVASGDAVALARPPQGGQVVYVALRVRNMNRCGVQMRGRFRDPANNQELAFDSRTVDLIVDSDGWGRPDPLQVSTFANVALCPDFLTTRDNQGTTTTLEMAATDKKGHSVMVTLPVIPTCTAPDAAERALCVCECSRFPPSMMRSCAPDADMSM